MTRTIRLRRAGSSWHRVASEDALHYLTACARSLSKVECVPTSVGAADCAACVAAMQRETREAHGRMAANDTGPGPEDGAPAVGLAA